MELYKVGGAFCAALLVLLGLNFFSEMMFESHDKHHDEHLAFSVEVEESDAEEEEEVIDFAAIFAAADASAGESVFKKCQSCHKIADGENGVGPHLWGVINREIGGVAAYGSYSGALPEGEAWTPENLYAFLEAPKKWAKGTSMGFNGLRKSADRANLIAYLNEADGTPEPLTAE